MLSSLLLPVRKRLTPCYMWVTRVRFRLLQSVELLPLSIISPDWGTLHRIYQEPYHGVYFKPIVSSAVVSSAVSRITLYQSVSLLGHCREAFQKDLEASWLAPCANPLPIQQVPGVRSRTPRGRRSIRRVFPALCLLRLLSRPEIWKKSSHSSLISTIVIFEYFDHASFFVVATDHHIGGVHGDIDDIV